MVPNLIQDHMKNAEAWIIAVGEGMASKQAKELKLCR